MNAWKRFAGFCKRNRHMLYILPWLLGFFLFQAAPMLYSLVCGFTDFHLFRGISDIGFANYGKILTDAETLGAIGRTLLYTAVTVPLKILAALAVAYLLHCSLKGIGVFRTLYYLPSILGSSVAAAVLWKALFRDGGVVNHLLEMVGLAPVSWLAEPQAALWVVILLRVWEFGSPMVLLLAALQQIPRTMLEAARLDGAGGWAVFWHIQLPMISPVLFYSVLLQICAALQEFNAPFIITDGGPMGSTTLISLLIYRNAFGLYEMGYASALAWVLFLLTAVFVGLYLLIGRGRLFDGQEESA
ncbi:MAG: sugar ABC transporter permease [Oscillospiraceae bacterium]|nr:sugar ABC transporter permease [Oscillospiraceae bacterium]